MPIKICRGCGKEFGAATIRTLHCSGECFRKKEREYSNRHRAKFSSERRRANILVGCALAKGDLVRQPCETCGSRRFVEAHHDDYAHPLAVRWLCKRHHRLHHHQFGPGKNAFRAEAA